MIRILSIALTACALLAPLSRAENKPAPKERFHIYLLIGQSNMAGRAKMLPGDEKPIERCFLLNDKDEWEDATNPLNRYSTIRKGLEMQQIGPGYGFAMAMTKADKNVNIGLVVNAKGGSAIEQWKKGSKFYNDAVRRTKEAMKDGTLKGILWHQGEANEKNPDEYPDKLKELIEDLRKDLGVKDLPFVVGQVNNLPEINKHLAETPKKIGNTGCASS